MTRLLKTEIARRFQRAIRLDVDLRSQDALADYVPLPVSLSALVRMGEQIAKSTQRAFTWTGPYGGGKSSLALLLAALLHEDLGVRKTAQQAIGVDWSAKIQKAFNVSKRGWLVVPVVGQRDGIVRVLNNALTSSLKRRFRGKLPKFLVEPADDMDPQQFLLRLRAAAGFCSSEADGILIIMDEMGRLLEHSAATDGDISFLQELAEIVGRSKEKIVVVGVLHQAFEQYASKLGGDSRDEWAKIQGRFVDISLTTGPEDTVRLIAQALVGDKAPREHAALCNEIAAVVRERRVGLSIGFSELLKNCWPLHPLVALLLASVSRKRFGQNERSTFGFLNSGEPGGFQEFLSNAADRRALYGLEEFWNYLRLNLEPAILASSDGHRWAQAVEAIDRTESKGEKKHIALAKAIAALDLFGNVVGLYADDQLIREGVVSADKREAAQLLDDLKAWSTVVYRAHSKSWAVFAGSDFDIDTEVAAAKAKTELDFAVLQKILTQQVIIAKKHYYETGTLRWFEVKVCALEEFSKVVENYRPSAGGACGLIALAIPKGKMSPDVNGVEAELLSERESKFPFLLGVSRNAGDVRSLTQELAAIEYVRVNTPALEGDPIARRELAARSANAREQLDQKMGEMLGSASWYNRGKLQDIRSIRDLSRAVSDCAAQEFSSAPVIRNELINRSKPSSNAISASNEMMRLMVLKSSDENLGIEGYPPQRAIYQSVLVSPGFHRRDKQTIAGFKFDGPTSGAIGKTFASMWAEGEKFLDSTEKSRRPLSDLYDIWEQAPFGIRLGVIPIYALALILAKESQLALYLDGKFVPELDSYFVDRLLQDAGAIQVRKFAIAGVTRSALEKLAALVSDRSRGELTLDALSVAKPLVSFVRSLHPWVRRTRTLSLATASCRDCVLKADDPIALLFEDLPLAFGLKPFAYNAGDKQSLGLYTDALRKALDELRSAYPGLLDKMSLHIGKQLGVTLSDEKGRFQISERASAVAGLSGDFRLDAFAGRLKTVSDAVEWLESISGLAANKPLKDWIDNDVDRATFEISDLSARFSRAETVAGQLGHSSGTEAVAIVVGQGTDAQALMQNVHISAPERALAREILSEMRSRLTEKGLDQTKLLSVVAQIAREVITSESAPKDTTPAESSERPKTWSN